MNDVLETLKKLPRMCAANNPADDSPILIKRGVKGYWPAPRPGFDVDAFNARHGVTVQQREAMLAGSMFGWELPVADPDIYTPDGTFHYEKTSAAFDKKIAELAGAKK